MAMLQQVQLQTVLKRATAAAQSLEALHASQHVHGDLDPQSFRFDAHGGVRLQPAQPGPSLSLHKLHYASPEQAGCLSPVGPRSDLYSLGLIVYEWLLDQPAFASNDPLKLAYLQIAVMPATPHSCNAGVPQQVSELVMRLLAKSPLERYASAQGVADDLQRCLQQLDRLGRVERFALGSTELHAQLTVPERLYGRAEEMSTLVQLWQRATQGSASLCLLSGEAGMGKSALAEALGPSVRAAAGHWAQARCVRPQSEHSHGALLQACRSLLQPLALATAAQQAPWRAHVAQALGDQLPVLLEVLPDMEWLLGPQPAAPAVVGLAAQRRLHAALRELLLVFAQAGHALLLYLDDLQWVDAASVALLRDLLQDPRAGHLLLLGAYREEAVEADHPVTRLRNLLHTSQAPLLEIRLGPLSLEEVSALVNDCCARISPLQELCARVMQQGQGNPGATLALLQQWVVQGQLQFDRQASGWRWSACA